MRDGKLGKGYWSVRIDEVRAELERAVAHPLGEKDADALRGYLHWLTMMMWRART